MPKDMPDNRDSDESARPPIGPQLREALDLRVDEVIKTDEAPSVKIIRSIPEVKTSQPPVGESEVDEILRRHGIRPAEEGEVTRRDDLAA